VVKEIDLHTDSFLKDSSGMSNEQLVQKSLQRMRNELDKAIDSGIKEIRFIHGRGTGVLKERVYHELRVYEKDGLIERFEPAFFNHGVVIVTITF